MLGIRRTSDPVLRTSPCSVHRTSSPLHLTSGPVYRRYQPSGSAHRTSGSSSSLSVSYVPSQALCIVYCVVCITRLALDRARLCASHTRGGAMFAGCVSDVSGAPFLPRTVSVRRLTCRLPNGPTQCCLLLPPATKTGPLSAAVSHPTPGADGDGADGDGTDGEEGGERQTPRGEQQRQSTLRRASVTPWRLPRE